MSALIASGFDVTLVVAPHGHPARRSLRTIPIFTKKDDYLPYFYHGYQGAFGSTGGGYSNIMDVLCAVNDANRSCPMVLTCREEDWEPLEKGLFYSTTSLPFGAGCVDQEGTNIIQSIWEEEMVYGVSARMNR